MPLVAVGFRPNTDYINHYQSWKKLAKNFFSPWGEGSGTIYRTL